MQDGRWINFKEIRERVSLTQVIYDLYGITTLKRNGMKLIGPCPVHGGDSPQAFHADLERDVWHCFSRCKRGGNQLDFVALKENISIRDAALRLDAAFPKKGNDGDHAGASRGNGSKDVAAAPSGKAPTAPRDHAQAPPRAPGSPARAPAPGNGAAQDAASADVPFDADVTDSSPTPSVAPREKNPPLELTLVLRHDHPHLISDRGLKEETVQRFGVGYTGKGILRGMIAIPIHDEDGVLVAYAGRRLKPQDIREQGKYKLPKGFRKDVVLFNLHRARALGQERGLVLVEGYFDVLKLFEAGFPNTVAAMGSDLSDAQAELLATAAKEVIVFFDGDEAGRKGAAEVMAKLEGKVLLRVVRLPEGTSPGDLGAKTVRWILNGLQALDLEEVGIVLRAPRPNEPPTS